MHPRSYWGAFIAIEDHPTPPGERGPRVIWRIVNGDYFGALRIPLRRGRAFGAQDNADAPPSVIINETMARRFWPEQDPVGKRIRFGAATEPWSTIVGVVGDVRQVSLASSEADAVVNAANADDSVIAQLLVDAEQRIFLADMSGDGLSDVVLVHGAMLEGRLARGVEAYDEASFVGSLGTHPLGEAEDGALGLLHELQQSPRVDARGRGRVSRWAGR